MAPARTRRTLLTGGWVVPMAGRPPFRGDVLIEDDGIAAVGVLGSVADAEIVDARDRIVLPGLVDTHRHLWQSALRGIAGDWTLGQYFARMRGRLGGLFAAEDTYAATLLGAVGLSGIKLFFLGFGVEDLLCASTTRSAASSPPGSGCCCLI